jgi:nuclear pore complex protein Nup98-Nup96
LTNTSNNTGFGATSGNALGSQQLPECPGTAVTAYQVTSEKEPNSVAVNNFQSITFMQPYQKYSFEVSIIFETNHLPRLTITGITNG